MSEMTNSEIRRYNFWVLIHPRGYTTQGVARAGRALDMEPTRVRQWVAQDPSKITAKNIGQKVARHIEACYKKPTGWLDQPHLELWSDAFSESMEADMERKGMKLADSGNGVYNVINQTEKVEIRRVPVISKEQAAKWNSDPESFDKQSHEEWVSTEEEVSDDTFAIRMMGDTMTSEAGLSIPNGSLLLVEPGIDPGDQQIVVAEIKGEVVIKQLVLDAGNYYLKSLNSNYKPVLIDENTNIIGVASDLIFTQKLPK